MVAIRFANWREFRVEAFCPLVNVIGGGIVAKGKPEGLPVRQVAP